MIKLSVNLSNALIGLVQEGQVRIDAIETTEVVPLSVVEQARQQLPDMPFHLHAGRFGMEWFNRQAFKRLLNFYPQSPWISWHLAPLPYLVTFAALRRGIRLHQPPTRALVRRFIRKINKLQSLFKQPVILENMPVLPTGGYFFESNPAVITRILDETGCPILLDLAHARISAQARTMPVEAYLLEMPLKRVVQVHLAGVTEQAGRLIDTHQSLQEEDYVLLEWVLPRIQPQWVTLEYWREDAQALKEQLTRIRTIIQQ